MMDTLVRVALGSYPPWWRRRYAAETADLTKQLMSDSGASRWRVLISLLFGSIVAWAHVRRIGDYLKPQSSPNAWGMVPQGSHRDIFGNRGLWPHSEEELEPDEVLLGVVDGYVGPKLFASIRRFGGFYLIFSLMTMLQTGPYGSDPWAVPAIGAVLLVFGSVFVRVTQSYAVAIAVTSRGVAVFRRHPLSGRTGKLIHRMPAVDPQILKARVLSDKVKLGDLTVWVKIGSHPLLNWMSATLRA